MLQYIVGVGWLLGVGRPRKYWIVYEVGILENNLSPGLAHDLLDVFIGMVPGEEWYDGSKTAEQLEQFSSEFDGDRLFADGITDAVADSCESGSISTTDAGTISAGVFTGAGTGQALIPAAVRKICANTIYAFLAAMRESGGSIGDDQLADCVATALDTMVSAQGNVTCDVSGTATSGSSSVTVSGTAVGSLVTASKVAALKSGLVTLFRNMQVPSNRDGYQPKDDSYLATEWMSLMVGVGKYFGQCPVSTNGTLALSGSVGNGQMSGNM
jgi:hypothetical protein